MSKQSTGWACAGGTATAKLAITAAASTGKEVRRTFFIEPSTSFATEQFPQQNEVHVEIAFKSIYDIKA